MGSCRSGASRGSGFAARLPQSRFWLERGASAALSTMIVGLLLSALSLSLIDNSRWARVPAPSPAITVITLNAPHDRPEKSLGTNRVTGRHSERSPRFRLTQTSPHSRKKQRSSALTQSEAPVSAALPTPAVASATAPLPSPGPTLVDRASMLDAYSQQLWTIIAARRPPGIHLDGEVGIAFDLDPDGRLQSAMIVQSSGDPMMDRLALGTVRRAAPFPKPPVRDHTMLTFIIRFRFR